MFYLSSQGLIISRRLLVNSAILNLKMKLENYILPFLPSVGALYHGNIAQNFTSNERLVNYQHFGPFHM